MVHSAVSLEIGYTLKGLGSKFVKVDQKFVKEKALG